MAHRSLKQRQKVQKVGAIHVTVMVEECVEVPPDAEPEWDDCEDTLLASWEEEQLLREAPQLFAMAGYTYSQQEYLKKETRSVKEIVPTCYHQYLRVFLKDILQRFPDHGPYDNAIELVQDAKMFHSRVYPLSPNEQGELD